jgi:phage antirepressor YoqD-like protein
MGTEVIRFDDQQTMTSLQIAEVTGKRHSDVLEAIRNMEPAWEKVAQRRFPLGSYKDSNNQSRPCYYLNKRECLYIATKFNDEARAKLILRWEELENAASKNIIALPNFSNPAEAARAWAEQYESRMLEAKRADEAEQQVLQLAAEVEKMQPKVSYYDMILNNKSTVLVTQIAQDYGMSAKAFNKTLNELGVQRKVNDQWILYASYLGQGYVQSKPVDITHNDGSKSVKYNTEWTQKGRLFLYDFLKQHDILPAIEQTF